MHLQMPAHVGEAQRQRHHLFGVRPLAQMAHEIKANTAKALCVETLELRVADRGRRQCDTAVIALLGGDGIGHHAVVIAVAGGLHDDAMPDAQQRVQREQLFLRRVGRNEGCAGGIGEHRAGPEHVHMRIAGALGQLQCGLVRRGEVRRFWIAHGWCALRASLP